MYWKPFFSPSKMNNNKKSSNLSLLKKVLKIIFFGRVISSTRHCFYPNSTKATFFSPIGWTAIIVKGSTMWCWAEQKKDIKVNRKSNNDVGCWNKSITTWRAINEDDLVAFIFPPPHPYTYIEIKIVGNLYVDN